MLADTREGRIVNAKNTHISNPSLAAAGASLAGTAITALTGAPEKISTLLHRRYPTVAVTGMTGAGKTRLIDRLARRTTPEAVTEVGSATMERRTSKSARLKGFRFRVVPGDNAATRLAALDEVFYDEPADGVIHVVSYGHATPRRAGGTSGKAPERTREEQLALEVEDWAITAHRIAAMAVRRARPVWVVIAVTKADLYPNSIDDAVEYYSPGSGSAFAAKLDELRTLAGGAKISIDVLPVSAENSKEMDALVGTLEARMAQLSGHV